ncbi:YlbF family regulator [Planococcus sp. SE5232]|uniref:YlbF family regulator n=1 Tax=unclassified Planococcus (in: firmicutes) TaxID=2662419 RepID=UPI001CBB0247|nr:YlbF family regulator [Planococcus sp. 4-30]
MAVNIYDDINKLESTFRATDEFKKLEEAVAQVTADNEANELFKTFRDLQISLQQKQTQGEEITEEEMMNAQSTAQAAQQNEKILAMLEAEMGLSQMIEEVNRVLIKPVQSLYESM